jgi:hypothetical protein
MTQRWFTPMTARRELPKVKPAAERMCRLFRVLQQRRPSRVLSDQRVEPAYFTLVQQLHAALQEINSYGVQVKDVQHGLLDFPARRQGREVLLCWKVGEPSLEFWHETEAGFAGRQPLADDGAWEES